MPLREKNHLSTPSIAVLSLLLAFLAPVSLYLAETSNNGWKMIKVGGRDYVSVQSVKSFYNFTKLTRTGNSVVLENKKVEMKLKVGGNECLMNNVKFVFSN